MKIIGLEMRWYIRSETVGGTGRNVRTLQYRLLISKNRFSDWTEVPEVVQGPEVSS